MNLEKVVFGAVAMWLVYVSVALILSRPNYEDHGPQKVSVDMPRRLAALDLSHKRHLSEYLIGVRGNPFTWRDDYVVAAVDAPTGPITIVDRPADPKQPTRPKRTPRKPVKPIDPGKVPERPKPEKPKVTAPTKPPRTPKLYELPVTLAGIYMREGKNYALLKDKQNDGYIKLVEGEEYPNLGISVVKVTKGSVILANDEGKHFLLRDLLRQIQAERLKEAKN